MMQCRQCQSEVDLEKWKFCPHCGGVLTDERLFLFFRKIFSSKRNIAFFIVFEMLFLGGVGAAFFAYQQKIEQKNQKIEEMIEKNNEVKVDLEVKEKIFPLTYVNGNKRLAELRISSPIYGKLRTEVEVPGLIDKDVQNFDITPEIKIHYLNPDISEEGYRKLADSRKAELIVRVVLVKENGEEKILIDDRKDIFFFSRNDIIWNEDGKNNSEYVVRLINKDKDEIKELVRKAADHMKEIGGESNAMVGSLGDEAEMKRQLKAIFMAIQKDYDIRYVMSPFSYDDIHVQRIKTPEEVIRTQSGLCIELSLLVAAALENIGLNSVLVLTSGHAWVGIETSPMSDKFIFIETTVLDKNPQQAIDIAQEEWESIRHTRSYKLLKVNELRAEKMSTLKY